MGRSIAKKRSNYEDKHKVLIRCYLKHCFLRTHYWCGPRDGVFSCRHWQQVAAESLSSHLCNHIEYLHTYTLTFFNAWILNTMGIISCLVWSYQLPYLLFLFLSFTILLFFHHCHTMKEVQRKEEKRKEECILRVLLANLAYKVLPQAGIQKAMSQCSQ